MTLKEVINTAPGTFINQFSATVVDAKTVKLKNGNPMYTAKARDGNEDIELVSFDTDLSPFEGMTVTFSGKGIKRDEYNGRHKVLIGKGVQMSGNGSAPKKAASAPVAAFDAATYMDTLVEYRILCEQAAQRVAAEFDGGMESAHVQAIASGFFINLTRKVGL